MLVVLALMLATTFGTGSTLFDIFCVLGSAAFLFYVLDWLVGVVRSRPRP